MEHFAIVLSLCAISSGIATSSTSVSTSPSFNIVRGKRSTSENVGGLDGGGRYLVSYSPSSSSDPFLSSSSSTSNERTYENDLRNLPEWSVFKRAPMGFVGMRGKKDFEYSDYSSRARTGGGGGLDSRYRRPRPDNKRVPMGFIAMHGKKDLDELDQYNDIGDNSIVDLDYEQKNSNLQDAEKRAPASGFFGMRGKKSFDEFEDSYNDVNEMYEKRAPTGFLGMRGKKRFYGQYYDAYADDKREPKGFFGMRGKRDDILAGENNKRSLAQFFGIRGKKQPFQNSGFFGMRGKKQPFQFRSKFVGVRGKKTSEGSMPDESMNEKTNDEMQNSVNDNLSDKIKRAPMGGFVGMRGKKGSDDTNTGQ